MNKRWFVLIILLAIVSTFQADASKPKDYSAEELFRKYKHAVVKILVRQQLIPVATGTGFFVGSKGILVTNHHVIKNVLKTGSFTVDFILADGKTVRDFQVSHCRDDRGIDLCVLKLNIKPKAWFDVSGYEPSPGETVYTVGHPQGLDFSITNGIISAVRKSPARIEEIQVTAAISPGNSGGPIFNSRGSLVGVVSKFFKEGQNLNFGITNRELREFLNKPTSFVNLAQYRRAADAKIAVTVQRLIKEMMDPAYKNAGKGKNISEINGFKDVQFDFGDTKLRFPLPKLFTACERVATKKGTTAFQCTTDSNGATFSVSRVPASPNAPLHELEGKKPVKEKPLPIVDLLMQDGSWAVYEANLSAENRKYLYSVPSEAKCRKLQGQTSPQSFFDNEAVQCRFSIFNDLEPDAYSHSIWIQRGRHIYDFYVWMEDASLADYMNHVPSLAVLGARSGDPLPPLTVLPFRIEPSPAYTLLSKEELSDGTTTYLFSRARQPASGSTPMFMVNVLRSSFAKRDLTKRARQLFEGTLDGFNTELIDRTLKLEPITADEMPGMVATAKAKRRDSNLAVFHATLLDEKSTFMIFAYGDQSESERLLQDFMKMTLSIRRNPAGAQ